MKPVTTHTFHPNSCGSGRSPPPSPFAPLRPLLKPDERDAADWLRKLAAHS